MGRWSRVLAPRFVEWARLPAGASVLDVGCGTGSTSFALSARDSRVMGVDVSPGFVARAESFAGPARDRVRFEVGDAMKLRFPDGTFDAVVSSLVLNFVPDPAAAVGEMRRVVRKAGIVAACVWDYAEGMQMLRHFWDAAVGLGLPGARNSDEGVRFPVCRREPLADAFRTVGPTPETGHIDVPMLFRDFDDYWRPFLSGIGPAGGFAMRLSEEQRTQLRGSLRSRLPTNADGSIHLVSRAWTVRVPKA